MYLNTAPLNATSHSQRQLLLCFKILISTLLYIFPVFSSLELPEIINSPLPPGLVRWAPVPDSSAFGCDGDGCRAWGGVDGADDGDAGGDESGPGGSGVEDREWRPGRRLGAKEVLMTERRAGGDTRLSLWRRKCHLRCRCPSLPGCRSSPETGEEDAGIRRTVVHLCLSQQERTSTYLGADSCSSRVQQSLHSILAAQKAIDRPPVTISALWDPSQGSQQSGWSGCLATELLLQGCQPDQVLQRGRGGALGRAMDGAAIHVPLRARADAGGEAVGDGEREGDGGR